MSAPIPPASPARRGRRSHRQAEEDDDDVRPIVRMPQRQDISKQNVMASNSPVRNQTTKNLQAIPSTGPEFIMDDDEDIYHSKKKKAPKNSSMDNGPEYDMDEGHSTRSGASSSVRSRYSTSDEKQAYRNSSNAGTATEVRPGAVAVSGSASSVVSGKTMEAASVASSTNSAALALAPGVEGAAPPPPPAATRQVSADSEAKRRATAGRTSGAATRPGAVAATGAAASLLTEEEMKAAALATSRAQQQQSHRTDSEIKASARAGHPTSQTPASPLRQQQYYHGASSSSTSTATPTVPVPNVQPGATAAAAGLDDKMPQDERVVIGVTAEAHSAHRAPSVISGAASMAGTAHYASYADSIVKDEEDVEAQQFGAETAIVAELAPNEDDVADRIAERVRAQMEERYGKQLEEQLKKNEPKTVVAVKMDGNNSTNKTKMEQAADNDDDQDEEEKWCWLGFSKQCVVSTFIIAILVTAGVLVGVLFGLGIVGGTTDEPPTDAPTSSPTRLVTSSPTTHAPSPLPTSPPTSSPTEIPESPRFELLFESMATVITDGSDVAVAKLRDHSTPQYKALEWLANQDGAALVPDQFTTTTIKERYALMVFYFQTGQLSRLQSLDWLSPLPVCAWYNDDLSKGVKCNGPRVNELRLRELELQGQLPTELGLLRELTILDMDENFLVGTIPGEMVAPLSNMVLFWFLNNLLTGTLPTEFGSMGALATFDVAKNALSGSIPTELAGVNPNALEYFFYDNNLNGTIPTEFGDLYRCIELDFDNNQFTGNIPSEIGNALQLQELYMSNNQLTGTIPTDLGRLVDLDTLHIYRNQLQGTVPTEFVNLIKLERLELNFNDLTGSLDPMFCDISRVVGWTSFYSDCGGGLDKEIACSCCTHCCTESSCTATLLSLFP